MLNTLANHDYLPHSGRNITVENLAEAINSAIGWSRDFGSVFGTNAFAALGGVSQIKLEDLFNREVGLERPASLARPDDSRIVSPERVQSVIDDSTDAEHITVDSIGTTRNRLEKVAPLTPGQQGPARGEAAFVLLLMVDGEPPAAADGFDYDQLKAFKDRSYALLAEERLPLDLGWEPSKREVQIADIGPVSAAIAAAQKAQA